MSPLVHLPSVRGRLRADGALLLLVAAVVAATSALASLVAPVAEGAADRAVVATVREAGDRGTVTASLSAWDDAPDGAPVGGSADQVRRDAALVRASLPPALDAVLRPGVAVVTTTSLQLLDDGPGRYVRLAFLAPATDGPSVAWTSGRPPGAGAGTGPGPVQVALSDAAARALDVSSGDVVRARDERGRSLTVRVSATFAADDPADPAWLVAPEALSPAIGAPGTGQRTSATALVSDASLEDLRRALPGDALTRRVVFVPEPDLLTWRGSAALEQTIVSLQARATAGAGATTWDTLLDSVVRDARAQVASARGQAQVLLTGLLAVASLVLVLAGQLLARRRAGPLTIARERGAGLPALGVELLVESTAVSVAAAVVGVGAVAALAGPSGWAWALPVVAVASVAPAVSGMVVAADATRRAPAPANRSARRARARSVRALRALAEVVVVVVASLTWVALHQRGVVGRDGAAGDPVAASAVTWASVVAAIGLVRLVPVLLPPALAIARRAAGGVGLFVATRLGGAAAARALPAAVVVVALAQITFGAALAVTLREGQAAGAVASVGGDARLDARPDPAVAGIARQVLGSPGVRAAAAARVEDGVRVSGAGGSVLVRLVVVDDPVALERVLAAAGLDEADLGRLGPGTGDRVPALVRGGPPGTWEVPSLVRDDVRVPLEPVGRAPDVGGTTDPVVVVDASGLAALGVATSPDTVWAVGPGAGSLTAAARSADVPGSVVTSGDELARRRDAPLPAAMVDLAVASCTLLLLLAVLGVALAAAADAPARRASLGRLRALGLPRRDLGRVVGGDLVVPAALAALVGAIVGWTCAHLALGSMSLDRLTRTPGPPPVVVPWWTCCAVLLVVAAAAVVAVLDARRTRRTPLARLLRS